MAEIIKPDCFTHWQPPEDEMTRQFLEQTIRTLNYEFRKACDESNQDAIEKIFDMRTKTLRLLNNALQGV